jgi:two-component system response regulator DevR
VPKLQLALHALESKAMEQAPTDWPCRVGLIDDHEILSVAFAATLARVEGLAFAGSAATVDQLLASLPDLDLVVLDLRLADGSSPANNVDRIVAAGAQVLAYTSGENPYMVRLVAKSGALGVIRKSEPMAVLIEAIKNAAHGRPVVSTDWAAALDSDPELGNANLSPQEQKVLTLFADGNKAQVVASRTGLALGTIEDYVKRIRTKYARTGRPANTKIDLYKRAIEDGFLPIPGRKG